MDGGASTSGLMDAYDGRDAATLRTLRFALERAVRDGDNDDAQIQALSQLTFLYSAICAPRMRDGAEENKTAPLDFHARPFRLSAQRTLLDHVSNRHTKDLRDTCWTKVAGILGVSERFPAIAEGGDGAAAASGASASDDEDFLKSLPPECDVEGLLQSEAFWAAVGEADIGEGDYAKENERTTPSSPSSDGGKRKSPSLHRMHKVQRIMEANADPIARRDAGHPPNTNGRRPFQDAAQASRPNPAGGFVRPTLPSPAAPPSGVASAAGPASTPALAPAVSGLDPAVTVHTHGANFFKSAKQALRSNDSKASRAQNYSHVMSAEERTATDNHNLLGWNKPSMYKRRQAGNAGLGGGGNARPGGFVPPYVRKALDNSGGSPPGGRAGAHGGGGGGEGEKEDPFPPAVMALLMPRCEGGELPEAILRLDSQLLEGIVGDIMDHTGVGWADIVGQEDAKRLVQEMVVWPMLNPAVFSGARSPPKGLLLFGPPGTGKTLIGKAIASNIKATFFNISASSLTSKWIGEGEKMVRTLFTLAGFLQPSVIFIDEIDSILSARKSDGEHEASRRLKTELLVQIEGCDPSSSERRVLIVGATNRPEELDEAARRRMPKQLYIPLPCDAARRTMIAKGLKEIKHDVSGEDVSKIVSKTAGYSGSDMRNFIQEALQGPVRDALKDARGEEDIKRLSAEDLRGVVLKDFKHASLAQRATVSEEEIARYQAYNAKHGTQTIAECAGMNTQDDW